MRRSSLAAFVLLTLSACAAVTGLDAYEIVPDGADGGTPAPGSEVGAETAEAGADGGTDASSVPATCSCPLTPPAGFSVVAFAHDRSGACTGDLTTEDLISGATAGAGACTCGTCTVTTMPSCASSTFTTENDNAATATCSAMGGTVHPTTPGCQTFNGTLDAHARVVAPAPSGGACTAGGVPNQGAVTTTNVRICRASGATCACDSALGTTFATCLRASGDVACPAATPNKTLVAATADVTCAGCSCSVAATCLAKVTWFADLACQTVRGTIDSATCTAQTQGSYGSFEYTVAPDARCQPGGSPAATAALHTPDTICCPM